MIQSIPQDRSVYVTQYRSDTTLEQLKTAFSEFGKIEQLQQNAKGVFIVFDSTDAVIRATSKTVTIQGKNLDVNQYLDMDKLDEEANVFIDGLSPTTTQLELKDKLNKFGKILNIKVQMSDKAGVAYIQFEKKSSADKCIAEQAQVGLHITKALKKVHKTNIKRDQLFISNIKSPLTIEQIKSSLDVYFKEYGTIESIQVNINPKNQTYYAFVKFEQTEEAYKAVKANKPFLNTTILIQWAVNSNENIEANLYTKNLKSFVTEQILREAFENIVILDDLQILPPRVNPKIADKPPTLSAYIYLKSAEDGKKVIDLAFKTKAIFELYEKHTVQISPMLSPAEQIQFRKISNKPFNAFQQPFYPPPFQQNFPPQYPTYPPNLYQVPPPDFQPQQYPQQQQQQYPQQQYRQHNNYQRDHYQPREHNNHHQPREYNNQRDYNNQYKQRRPQQPHQAHQRQQPRIPDLNFLQNLLNQGQKDKVTAIVGGLLFPLVEQQINFQQAKQVTGILLDFANYNLQDQLKMLQDSTFLTEEIKQAVELLNENQ